VRNRIKVSYKSSIGFVVDSSIFNSSPAGPAQQTLCDRKTALPPVAQKVWHLVVSASIYLVGYLRQAALTVDVETLDRAR